MTYFRAIDPLPLEGAEHNKLHEFYTRLGAGRLATTRCTGCGHTAWPPRGFCGECAGDQFEWVDLPGEGTIHAFTAQETGLPAGFEGVEEGSTRGPRVFAIVKIGGHRVFTVVTGAEPARLALGQRVRLQPLKVADEPRGGARWLPAFVPA